MTHNPNDYNQGIAQYYGNLAGYGATAGQYVAGVQGQYDNAQQYYGAMPPGLGGQLGAKFETVPGQPRGTGRWVIGTAEEAARWGCPIGTPIAECPNIPAATKAGYAATPAPAGPSPDAPILVEPFATIPMFIIEPKPPVLMAIQPRQAAKQERPAWVVPTLVGGGIAALSGLGYILWKARRTRR